MDVVCVWLGWAMLAVGVVGCFIPVIPGPPLAYASLLVVHFFGGRSVPTFATLLIVGAVTVAVTVLDYIVPAIGAKKFNCSKYGTFGCFVGTIVGLFFLPLGIILGPFIGALSGELMHGRPLAAALYGAVGALLGYLAGLLLKIVCCGYIAVVFWKATT